MKSIVCIIGDHVAARFRNRKNHESLSKSGPAILLVKGTSEQSKQTVPPSTRRRARSLFLKTLCVLVDLTSVYAAQGERGVISQGERDGDPISLVECLRESPVEGKWNLDAGDPGSPREPAFRSAPSLPLLAEGETGPCGEGSGHVNACGVDMARGREVTAGRGDREAAWECSTACTRRSRIF